MEENKNWDLLARKLNNELTPEEEEKFEVLLTTDPGFKEDYQKAQTIWKISKRVPKDFDTDDSKLWNKLKNRVRNSRSENKVFSLPSWVKVAAVFLMVAGIGYLAINIFDEDHAQFATVDNIEEFTFPDGSTVWLNKNSSVSYTGNFGSRNIELTGEAFFDVKKNPSRPFIISSGYTETKVLGTSFNVNTLEKDYTIVSVVTGKVSFSSSQDKTKEVLLTPGLAGVFNHNTGTLEKRDITDKNFLSWKTRVLTFESTPLIKVFQKLEKLYKVSIIVDEEKIKDCRFSGEFEESGLEEILEILSITFKMEYHLESTQVEISEIKCNSSIQN